jgi:hypothetical protein
LFYLVYSVLFYVDRHLHFLFQHVCLCMYIYITAVNTLEYQVSCLSGQHSYFMFDSWQGQLYWGLCIFPQISQTNSRISS